MTPLATLIRDELERLTSSGDGRGISGADAIAERLADAVEERFDVDEKRVPCSSCYNGRWFTECCNGSGGCSCRGEIIDMGRCHVCGGTGYRLPGADTLANAHSIAGFGFIGTGPRSGWDGMPRLGVRP